MIRGAGGSESAVLAVMVAMVIIMSMALVVMTGSSGPVMVWYCMSE